MMGSDCPDCGAPGKRIDWRPFSASLEEHVYVCNNLMCARARLPWSVFLPRRTRAG
ncbi:MAG: hypothetical protein QXU73_07630 [Thermoplasmata archaeon]